MAYAGIVNRMFTVIVTRIFTIHYESTPMQYTVIFHSCKKENFQMKNCKKNFTFAQNIDCGYTLEPPQ